MIDEALIEETQEFAPEKRLLLSQAAKDIENMPIFMKTDKAKNEIEYRDTVVHEFAYVDLSGQTRGINSRLRLGEKD
jgi:hypothetical protein